jgi:hypothetical protein
MHPPTSYRLSHRLARLIANRWRKVDEVFSMPVLRPSWSKGVSQKVELNLGMLSCAIGIFAVDNPSFLWM